MNKQGNAVIIGIVALLLLSIITIGTINTINYGKPFSLGFSTLSLSKVGFTSNDPSVGGDAFILTVVQNGAAQHAEGTFTSISADGKTAQKDLRVELDHHDQKCQYDLQTTSSTIKKPVTIMSGTLSTSWNLANKEQDCYAYGGQLWVNEGGISNIDYHCFAWEPIATAGNVVFDALSFQTDVLVRVEGENADTKTAYVEADEQGAISNTGQKSVSLLGGDVYATWQGYLGSGEQCPSSAEYDVMSAYAYDSSGVNPGWRIINEDKYDNYRYYYNNFEDCLEAAVNGIGTFYNCQQELNNYAYASLNTVSFASGGRYGTGTTNSGRYEITMNNDIEFPVISMRIKADTLGIYVPVGMPELVSADSDCFETGKNGNALIGVKNVAPVTATFDVNMECPAPFNDLGYTKSVTAGPGQTTYLNLALSGDAGTQTEVTQDCTITATDREKPTNKDALSFEACVVQIAPPCQENAFKCVGDVQHTCRGGEWEPTSNDDCANAPPPPPPPKLWIKLVAAFVLLLATGIFIALSVTNENLLLRVVFGALGLASLIGLIVIAFSVFSGASVWMVTIGLITAAIGVFLLIKGIPSIGVWFIVIGALLLIIGALIGVSVLYGQANNTPLWMRLIKR